MGIAPILRAATGFRKQYLGYAQSAFFGGRTSAHIRKVPVPVVYTDFLSMYPTVNALMGLWRYVVADEIAVVPGASLRRSLFSAQSPRKALFEPETWKSLPAFVRVIPRRRHAAEPGQVQPAKATITRSG